MSSKLAKKAADPVMEGTVAEAQVHDSETKKKKMKKKKLKVVKPTSELAEHKAPAEEPEKTVKAKKSEIDDIFGQKKRKKAEGGPDDDAAQAATKKKDKENSEVVKLNSKGELVRPKKMPQVAKPTKSTPAAAAPTSRKKTEDGFTVYTSEELGFNKKNAGGTKLCPFDCDCCF